MLLYWINYYDVKGWLWGNAWILKRKYEKLIGGLMFKCYTAHERRGK